MREVGAKAAVTPAGAPVADRVTVSAVPETSAVPMDVEPAPPATTESAAGVGAIEKSLGGGAEVTVRVTVVAWVADGAVPVTVIG